MRREYFEGMYAANPDPWGFTTRWYERRKYALTLAALSRPRYRSGFEPGCSIGVLTEALALRCDRLLSVDLVDAAVRQCRSRTAALPIAAGTGGGPAVGRRTRRLARRVIRPRRYQ